MNIAELMSIVPQLAERSERIQKAIATVERLNNDPDVQDAIKLVEEIGQIVAKQA